MLESLVEAPGAPPLIVVDRRLYLGASLHWGEGVMRKKKHRGIPGNYVLNQKSQVFLDRRTRRNRDRSTRNRKEIEQSEDSG